MPTVDDEKSLSDVNKQFKPEMEEQNLGLVGIEGAEICESIPELGDSSGNVGRERDERASLEDNLVADKGEEVFQDHVAGHEPEFAEEMVEMPAVVQEEVVEQEGGSKTISRQSGDSFLEVKAVEGANRIDDAEGVAVVTDIGGVPVLAESQVDNEGDELQVDHTPGIEIEDGEEFAPVVESKLKMVVTGSESRMNWRSDEIPVDPQLEETVKNDLNPIVDPEMEGGDTCVSKKQQLSELQTGARGVESNMVIEGIEAWKNEPNKESGDEENVEAVVGVDNESVEALAVQNNAKEVQGDQVNKEEVDVVNVSEEGTANNLTVAQEEHVDPGIAEVTGPKTDQDKIFEVNQCAVNVSEQVQVHESSDAVEYFGDGEECQQAEDKQEAAKRSLMSGTEMVNDENLSTEVSGNAKLSEPLNVADDKEVLVREEILAGDINPETWTTVKAESARNDSVEEVQSINAKVETEMETDFIADDTPDKDGKLETGDTVSDADEPVRDIYDSPPALQDEEDEAMAVEEETGTQDTEMETETEMAESGKTPAGKQRRGKLSKSPSISKPTAKSSSRKTVGDDVCFICFDGGELVLCDRRGCPKAYHPSCVNRDEAFFKSKGRWNCGWHLCSKCGKDARYMCYTCTFSLCKSCIKDFVFLCIRGNKGFCESCMGTVMLIENNERGDQDAQIDFDDRSSWEFLFKDYYIELKAKLSLSSVEIAKAKNQWKGADMSGPSKPELSEAQRDANGGSGSENSIENSQTTRPKRKKIRQQSKSLIKKLKLIDTDTVSGDKATSVSDSSEWASRELLEFVSHTKDGDTSLLSQFDVQALLLEYIKRNKLRDPRRKSQIICDSRLENIFGKPRVGHFEMLKLLESHFLPRDEQNDDFQGSVVDTENNQLDIDVRAESLSKGSKDGKRKYRKKSDSRGPQSNLDDYAAIDVHNIGLIYLRRKLMEDLLEDVDTFHDKVIGTFVRIRISGSTQKQDMYRLVQVVGTSKAAEPYKVGKRTTDIVVEILNLDKTEIILIDTISNQEFTEEECKRLRQSIKCGLISRLTVGEILDKTMEIQVARVNDWLESETLRLSHLRDRASDLGRRKQLRECVEKLQLLKTPEERRRRLEEIPVIHADPKMDPSYESDENDSENEDTRRDAFMRSRGSSFIKRGRGPISPGSDYSIKDSWSGAGKGTPSRDLSGSNFATNSSHIGVRVNENSWNLERERQTQEFNNSDNKNFPTNSESERSLLNVTRSESFSGTASVPSLGSSSADVVEPSVTINESEKMWHYQDPSGKVQGAFSMVQLRKWNNTGYFPSNLKIWKTTEKQENSVLLTDALVGKFPKEVPAAASMFPAGHSGKIPGTSLHQENESSYTDHNSGSASKLYADKLSGNDITLPSPTPKQRNSGLLAGAVQSPAVNDVLPSPTAVLTSTGAHSSPAPVLNSVVQTASLSPTTNSQQGILVDSATSLHTQSTTMGEPHMVHGLSPATVQSVQTLAAQNLKADTTQVWGTSSTQSSQTQGYGWAPPNGHTCSGIQPDVWRPPTQSSQPTMHSTATPNASWGLGPAENNTSMGARPQNPNIGWGTMQANPNMGWGNPPPMNTNINWGAGPAMQVPPPGNTSAWVPPPGNPGANIQGMVPGNANPGWVATQGWVAPPVQGTAPGNGWGPPSGNPTVQGPASGNSWGPPGGNAGAPVQGPGQGNMHNNQGSAPWGGDLQNHSGGQFSGQKGAQGRDSGLGGGRSWNRQPSFGGGGHRLIKRDTPCPYNSNGRCRKGAHCDYLHI